MKKTLLIGGLAALTFVAAGGMALAQQAPARGDRAARADTDGDARLSRAEFVDGRVQRLTSLDANRDGTVAREEMQAGREARREEGADRRFAVLDANSDGTVTRAEFDAAREARPDRPERAGRDGRRDGAGRGPGRGQGRGMGGRGMGGGGDRGPVVIAEVQTQLGTAFERLDADNDGYLTAEERRAGAGEMREQRRERRAERRAARQASPSAPASE